MFQILSNHIYRNLFAAQVVALLDGESGPKLIRRSIAQLLRDPKRKVPTEEIELQLVIVR